MSRLVLQRLQVGSTYSFELVFDHHFVREVAMDGATLHLRLGLISIC